MNPPKENDSLALLHSINRETLLPQLIAQLNKDAGLTGLDLDLPADLLPSQIVKILTDLIEDLLQNDFNTYLNFLYRVDIPEKRMLMHELQSTAEVAKHATLQVLSREWEKVWFKNRSL